MEKLIRTSTIALTLTAYQPIMAQMTESIDVKISADQNANIDNEAYVTNACAEAELLMKQGCFGEAAAAFSTQIRRFPAEKNQLGLDRACSGLYRAQYLSNNARLYDEVLALCRPKIVDPLLSKTVLEPMFITYPTFELSENWLDSAEPGAPYKVYVEFDIDEFGKAENFVFDANESYYLKFAVLTR